MLLGVGCKRLLLPKKETNATYPVAQENIGQYPQKTCNGVKVKLNT